MDNIFLKISNNTTGGNQYIYDNMLGPNNKDFYKAEGLGFLVTCG